MKRLIISIAIIVFLIAFFVSGGNKAFYCYGDVRTVQSESSTTDRESSVSVPEMKHMTEVNHAVEVKPADIKPLAEPSPVETNPVAKSAVLAASMPEEPVTVNEEGTEIQRIKDNHAENSDSKVLAETTVEVKPASSVVPDLTQEESPKNSEETVSHSEIIKEKVKKISLRLFHIIKKCFVVLLLFFTVFILEISSNNDENTCTRNKNSFKERLIQSTVPIILLFFNLMVFIPWNIFLGNASCFSFVFSDFFYTNLVCFFCVTIFFSFGVYFLPARIRDVLTDVISGLGLCFYFQAMFMNKYMGFMNGVEPEWNDHLIWGIINLIVWGIILSFPFLIKFRYPSHSRVVIRLTTVVLCLEIIAVISLVCSTPKNVWVHKQQGFCDASNQFQLSKKKNILVFIFDALSVDFVKDCFESDPSLKDTIKDFTWYEDALSNYNYTFAALPHELTGSMIHPSNNLMEMYKDLWQSVSVNSFYTQIKKAGYDSRLYVKCNGIMDDYDLFREYFSNIKNVETSYEVNHPKLYRCLFQLTEFSSFPYLLKRFAFYGGGFFDDVVQQYVKSNLEEPAASVVNTNDRLYGKLISEGITTNADSPIISFHYTTGAHRPWRVDEKCQYHEDVLDSYLPPTKSCFYFIAELIRQLKDNQIYDQTAILICSDHGHYSIAGCSTDFWAMTFMVKPFFANNPETVLDYSKVQSIDILPTILQLACEENADLSCFEGFPPSDIPFDRQRIEYKGIQDDHFDPFVGPDGNNSNFNAFLEFGIDSNNSRKKEYLRTIPLKVNAKKR